MASIPTQIAALGFLVEQQFDPAAELNRRAIVDDFQVICVQPAAIEKLHLHRAVRNDVPGACLDRRLRQPPLVSRGRGQNDLVTQLQDLRLGVEESVDGLDLHTLAIIQLYLGVDALEFQDFGLGQVLGGRSRRQLIGAGVAGEARQPRGLHGDLGARQRYLADIDREHSDQTKRIEKSGDDDHRRDHHDGSRDGPAHPAHEATMPRRGTEQALAVAPTDLAADVWRWH